MFDLVTKSNAFRMVLMLLCVSLFAGCNLVGSKNIKTAEGEEVTIETPAEYLGQVGATTEALANAVGKRLDQGRFTVSEAQNQHDRLQRAKDLAQKGLDRLNEDGTIDLFDVQANVEDLLNLTEEALRRAAEQEEGK